MRKKLLIGIGVFASVGLIVAAMDDSKKPINVSDSSVETVKSAPKETTKAFTVGDDVMVGDVRWKVLSALDRGSLLKASESRYPTIAKNKSTSGKYIEVTAEVENRSSELRSLSNYTIVDDQGRKYVAASDVSEWIPEGKDVFILANLNPNIPKQFAALYEVAVDAKGLQFIAGDLKLFGGKEAKIALGL